MCPRKLLANTRQTFEQEHCVKLLIGFEIEFIQLDERLQIPQTIDKIQGFFLSASVRGDNLAIVEEIFNALETSDIPVHHMHTEDVDRLEFSLDPAEPMVAVDGVMHG